MVLVGEVHTALLRNSSAVTAGGAAAVLGLDVNARARYGERPIRFAISADALTGVDCQLASSGGMPRGIGTVSSHATITGGQVLQGSSSVTIVRAAAQRRLPWSSYLAHPGRVEAIGRFQPAALGEGFLHAPVPPSTLDLGAVNARLVKAVQSGPGLDGRPAFRAQATRLRWVVLPIGDDGPTLSFGVQRNGLRTLRLEASMEADFVALCRDVALHDWLLTTIGKLIDHSRIGAAPRREVVARLGPALDYLIHLWMPGASVTDQARSIWPALDERAGFSRQWQASVDRIRDQLSLATISRLLSPHTA